MLTLWKLCRVFGESREGAYRFLWRWIGRPLRSLLFDARWLFLAEERQQLADAWHPKSEMVQSLCERFGYQEWEILRGGVNGKLVGFVPIIIQGKKRTYMFEHCVLDELALRGRAPCSLERLKARI
jgi:hypothetical protein